MAKFRRGGKVPGDLWASIKAAVDSVAIKPVWPVVHDPTANTLSIDESDEFFARITGAATGGAYPWREVLPAGNGTWRDGSRSGTVAARPIREINNYSGVPLVKVRVRRGRDGTLYFQGSNCP